MNLEQYDDIKKEFLRLFRDFVGDLNQYVSVSDGQWTIKGFIDIYKNVYTISSDTKVISKILEIHLFPKLVEFAQKVGYYVVPDDHQNYYPDLTFVLNKDENIKFAVDLKTTYRLIEYPGFCNGFTLGSHGEYFTERQSKKNIQFPYNAYLGHFCLGIIYSRVDKDDLGETKVSDVDHLQSIMSVIKDFQFFIEEKWKIASDQSGSGNTANIGSIQKIDDILAGQGVFSELGEDWFDDYWMNYDKISIIDDEGKTRKIKSINEFVKYRKGDVSSIVKRARRRKS